MWVAGASGCSVDPVLVKAGPVFANAFIKIHP